MRGGRHPQLSPSTYAANGMESDTLPALSLENAVANLEREMLIDALKNTRGNITVAAKILRTTVRKFSYKAEKYHIDYRNYR